MARKAARAGMARTGREAEREAGRKAWKEEGSEEWKAGTAVRIGGRMGGKAPMGLLVDAGKAVIRGAREGRLQFEGLMVCGVQW